MEGQQSFVGSVGCMNAAPNEERAEFRRSVPGRAQRERASQICGNPDQLQAALAALPSNSLHYTIQGAIHENLIGRREYGVIVVDVIRCVIKAAQTGQPLGDGNRSAD